MRYNESGYGDCGLRWGHCCENDDRKIKTNTIKSITQYKLTWFGNVPTFTELQMILLY